MLCPFEYLPFCFHFIFSMIFGICVFYKAAKENKLVYNKRQVQSLGIFFCLSTFYCIYYYLVGISIVNLGLKIKLFLWCFYFIVLKQFLVMVDRRKLFIRIFFILFILTLVALPWTLGMHGLYYTGNSKSLICRNIFPYNPNWFTCLCCFIYLYFCKEIKYDKNRLFLWTLLMSVLYLFQARASFFLSCFILPFLTLKKLINVMIIIMISLCGIYFIKFSNIKNNKITYAMQDNIFKAFTREYINGTKLGNYIEGFCRTYHINKKIDFRTNAGRENKEFHNFFMTFIVDFNFIEKCIFAITFWMFLNPISILFLLYSLTITTPLYFFIAFVFCIYKYKKI